MSSLNDLELLNRLSLTFAQLGLTTKQVKSTEITTRCAYCGDSEKSSHSTHMYIGLPNDGRPMSYYCQRCNVGGYVNKSFIDQYQIHDLSIKSDVISSLKNAIKNSSSKIRNTSSFKVSDYNYDFNKITSNPEFKEYYEYKLNYLKTRHGDNFLDDITTLSKYRIIVSPYDFFVNHLKTESVEILDKIQVLEMCYISYLTSDGSRVIFRKVADHPHYTNLKRFDSFKIFENVNPTFYSISSNIDMTKKITINLAEGISDIINVERKISGENSINIAVLNKDYVNKILYLLKILSTSFMIDGINIYSDSELSHFFYKKQLKKLNFIKEKIKIYKEMELEDFGIYKERYNLMQIKGVF